MKERIMQIALRIALIKTEFSEREILEAVKLLKEQGINSHLFTYLSSQKTVVSSSRVSNRKKIPTEEQSSQLLIELEKKAPEKSKLLADFESLLKNGDVLPDSIEIRRLGEHLSKNFTAKKSRTDLINKLIKLLAEIPIDEMRKIIKDTVSSSKFNEDEYQELANFLITGQSNKDYISE